MKTKILILFITILFTHLFAQEEVKRKDGRIIIINNDGSWKYKQNISIDLNNKKNYNSVKIGSQTWMVENLIVDHFRNGDPIPEVKTNAEWERAGNEKRPAWCYYNNDSSNGIKYGKLYNWYAVNDERGLAPKGWHVPTYKEFNTLRDLFHSDDIVHGNPLKAIGQGTGKGLGTNTSGYSALLGGIRSDSNYYFQLRNNWSWVSNNYNDSCFFYGLSQITFFWSSVEFFEETANTIYLRYDSIYLGEEHSLKKFGFSVRCIRD